MVRLEWHGHACFEIQGRDITVVTDPFRGIGIPEPKTRADIVLCSHSHQDHNNARSVLGKGGEVLEGFVGSKNIKGVSIKGVATFHDAAQGTKRGRNSVCTFSLDSVQFCHLGDLGHELSAEAAKDVGDVDVLFVPVGGYFTVGPEAAWKVCEKLGPKVIIPMHYRMAWLSPTYDALNTVDDFVAGKKNVERTDGPVLNIEKEKLPAETKIVVLCLR